MVCCRFLQVLEKVNTFLTCRRIWTHLQQATIESIVTDGENALFNNYTNHLFNPSLHADAFLRISSDVLKTVWPKVKLLMMRNFSFCHTIFHFQSLVIHSITEIFRLLTKYVQCRLLKICCHWRELKEGQKKTGVPSDKSFII